MFVTFAEGGKPGLKDDDLLASIATLQSISQSLDLECVHLRERIAEEGKVAEFLLRKKVAQEDFMEIRFGLFDFFFFVLFFLFLSPLIPIDSFLISAHIFPLLYVMWPRVLSLKIYATLDNKNNIN